MSIEKQLYVRLSDPEECQQCKIGKTPCFHNMTKDGVDCNLCPVQLATAKNIEEIIKMLHDGTCLMDERNSANMGAIARVQETGKRQYVCPINFSEDLVLE